MATGYEVQMYNDVRSIASSLERIANHLQATEMRRRDAENQSRVEAQQLLDEIRQDVAEVISLPDFELWKLAVTRDETILGYSQWWAWRSKQ